MAFTTRLSLLRRALRVKFTQARQRGPCTVLKESAVRLSRRLGRGGAPARADLHPFDQEYHTDTSGIVQPWNLDVPENLALHAVQYGTPKLEILEELLSQLPIHYPDYVFVDLGSGKGRALLLASRFPFRQILGIELSPALHQVACHNIEIFHAPWQRCTKLVSRCDNALSFELPEENLVLYLFNPFDEQILRPVIARLEASLQHHPRNVYLVYVKPVHRSVLDQSDFALYKTVGHNLIYCALPRRAETLAEADFGAAGTVRATR